jgi:hypothetical protein
MTTTVFSGRRDRGRRAAEEGASEKPAGLDVDLIQNEVSQRRGLLGQVRLPADRGIHQADYLPAGIARRPRLVSQRLKGEGRLETLPRCSGLGGQPAIVPSGVRKLFLARASEVVRQ